MGSSNKSSSSNAGATSALARYNQLYGPGSSPNPLTASMGNTANSFMSRYNSAADQSTADYSRLMGGYGDWTKGMADYTSSLPGATHFTYQNISSPTPAELQESYGYLRNAGSGFQNFADTGGYSPQDIQDLRARGIAPVRAAYANAQANIDRAKSLGGGYAPNYIAATSRLTRQQSQDASDATQNVNARLAEDIRSGKLSGLQGLLGVGGTMGGLSLQDAARILQANEANQRADLQSQGMTEESLQNSIKNRFTGMGMSLSGLDAQRGLYGTTPGQTSMFGSQALSAMGQYLQAHGMDQSNAAQLLGIASGNQQGQSGPAWWQYALQAAPYAYQAFHTPATASALAAGGSSAAGAGGSAAAIGGGLDAAGGGGYLGSAYGGGSAATGGATGGGGFGSAAAGLAPLALYGAGTAGLDYFMGDRFYPHNGPPVSAITMQQNQDQLQHLIEMYGEDSPIVVQFRELNGL